MAAFPDLLLTSEDFVEAAVLCNRYRTAGVQGSHTDFLICAVALRRQLPVFTTDRDFIRYADHVPLQLHAPSR